MFLILKNLNFPDILKVFCCRQEQMVGREHEPIRGILAELQLRVIWKSEQGSGRGVGLCKDIVVVFLFHLFILK